MTASCRRARAEVGKARPVAAQGDAMPHPDYRIQAHVCVACPGPEGAPTTGDGPKGEFVSKSQTTLRYAAADVRAWSSHFRASDEYKIHNDEDEDVVNHHVVLESAAADECKAAIGDAVERLDFHFDDSAGGSLNFVFSGHGTSEGDLILADRLVSPDELVEWFAGGKAGDGGKTRHLRLVIDSCYSGLTLCRILKHSLHWDRLVVRDGFAACLPSEEAFELRSLQRSVFTHTMLRAGKRLLGKQELTAEEIREMMAAQKETPQYLTNGAQHSLDVINGHAISASKGGGFVEATDVETLEELIEAVDALPRRRRDR